MVVSSSESVYVYLRVTAEQLPLREISISMGIDPTESWRKGDAGTHNPSRPDSGWCLYSPLPRSNLRIDEHIDALLPVLEERSAAVRDLSKRFDTYLVCVGHFTDSSPGLFLSKSVVARIAELGLSVDCDLYCSRGSVDGA